MTPTERDAKRDADMGYIRDTLRKDLDAIETMLAHGMMTDADAAKLRKAANDEHDYHVGLAIQRHELDAMPPLRLVRGFAGDNGSATSAS